MSNKVRVFIDSERHVSNKQVHVANVVTRGAQSLTLAEKRILFSGIAQLKGVNKDVKITAIEYAETFGLDNDTAYTQLKTAAENIFNRYLTFTETDSKKTKVTKVRWVDAYGYVDKEGYVIFSFSAKMFPYLFHLKSEFTQYRLEQAGALRSLHSWRLLELLEQMKNADGKDGWLVINIEDFHHAMESTPSYRSNFSKLRERVIEPSVKELNEKDNWAIHWEPLKRGRKVAALRFNFRRDPQERLF